MLFMKKTKNSRETLAQYYVRQNGHVIPDDVEIWEYEIVTKIASRIFR